MRTQTAVRTLFSTGHVWQVPQVAILLAVVVSAGCHHAIIDMGTKPSTVTIEQPWATGWIFGLVPPKTVEPASKCPHGVAKVETQITFVNGVVRFVTMGIYTPMWIKVTCAEPRELRGAPTTATFVVEPREGSAHIVESVSEAAEESARSGRPAYIRFAAHASQRLPHSIE